jgi:hypothetical protein
MAMRVKDGVAPIDRPTDMGRGGSRPQPPKAGARSASLEAPRPMSDHQTAKRRLTSKTVALDSAKGRALGTHHFSIGFQRLRLWWGSRGQRHRAGFRAAP